MRCISKRLFLIIISLIIMISFTACGSELVTSSYSIFDTSYKYNLISSDYQSTINNGFFATDLCVSGPENIGISKVESSSLCSAAGLFNLTQKEVLYAQNIYDQIYPASTTKIMTMLVVVENMDLNAMTVVSARAVDQEKDASTIKLKEGDVISVKDLLYGLELQSGNDAAIALAEACSGSVENFVELMNARAKEIGATNTNFVNSNGLHDENHYSTVYDMYLILNEALKNATFYEIFTAKSYSTTYQRASGETVEAEWKSTNAYLTGKSTAPSSITVLGGKTGTTAAAGYCLVLYSKNDRGEDVISIVFNADGRSDLYYIMNQILSNFGE